MKKIYSDIIKDIDSQKREVVFKFAKFNDYDSDNDIILSNAFDKTIKESGPSGADRVYHLWMHDRKNNPPIGKVLDLWADKDFAYAKSKMLNSELANNIFDGYLNNAVKEHSFWAKSFNHGINEKGGKTLKELKLLEVSTVIWGANENAKLVEVLKSSNINENETILDHIISLNKWVKKSKGTDDFIQSLEIELEKALDLIESLEKSSRDNTLEVIEPKIELSLSDIYKLKMNI
jgi:HK97 family phage prohead protease